MQLLSVLIIIKIQDYIEKSQEDLKKEELDKLFLKLIKE